MATGNKKSTSGKRKAQTSRKGSTGRKKKTAAQQQEDFTREVILWIIVAVSILLFISNFGIGGTIGNAVSRFFFGVMGLIAYRYFFCRVEQGQPGGNRKACGDDSV